MSVVEIAAPTSRVVDTLEGFSELASAWGELLRRAGGSAISREHGWLEGCLRHFPPREVLIILLEDASGRLLAAAPLKIATPPGGLLRRGLRRVQFIGTDPSVYEWMGFLIDPVLPPAEAIRRIAGTLADRRERWDALDLRYFRDPEQARLLLESLPGVSGRVAEDSCIPYLDLPPSIEAFQYGVCKKKQRRNLSNLHNGVRKARPGQALRLAFTRCGLDARLAEFSGRHAAYWAARGQRSDFIRYPALAGFYAAMLRRYATEGACQVEHSRLMLEEDVLGDEISIWQEGGMLAHLCTHSDAFSRFRPAKLHMEALIHEAIRRGGRFFSFGRGEEAYKFHWTDRKIPLFSLLAFSDGRIALRWTLDERLKALRERFTTGERED